MDLNIEKNVYISIILPVYNGEKHIENAIHSVLRQTYSNYELIVIDDGSTDKTRDVLNGYKEQEKIQIIEKANGGVSSARNAGLANVTGDYLMFLDSDDELMENCLSELVNYVKIYKDVDMIAYGWNEQGEKKKTRRITDKEKEIKADTCIEKIIESDYECGGGYPWNKLWKVSAIKRDVIPFFDEELVLCEDKEWTVRTLLNCKKILIIPSILYLYRIVDEEHLSRIDFDIREKKNDLKILSFMEASVKIEHSVLEVKPQTKLARIATQRSVQDVILVCYKAIKNRNDILFKQADLYYRRYAKKGKKNISMKHWLMLCYIYTKLFLTRNIYLK